MGRTTGVSHNVNTDLILNALIYLSKIKSIVKIPRLHNLSILKYFIIPNSMGYHHHINYILVCIINNVVLSTSRVTRLVD